MNISLYIIIFRVRFKLSWFHQHFLTIHYMKLFFNTEIIIITNIIFYISQYLPKLNETAYKYIRCKNWRFNILQISFPTFFLYEASLHESKQYIYKTPCKIHQHSIRSITQHAYARGLKLKSLLFVRFSEIIT